ncbi:hypothetical protein IT779_34445 [Nocardia sp. NEAU-351]|uniref:Phospholipase n=1 Tax=Nocardia bovistercoris TaxID=2785916 RepID=A0A931IKW0_9NOCA|nr:hypothetical protein [Nocardia bovistercoris]
MAVAISTMACTVGFAPPAEAVRVAPENPTVAAAVADLTGGAVRITLPTDFVESAGYLPEIVDGLLVNPGGDCSSPVPLPSEFETACKAHDLGYDLLRYADRAGAPLGPWARQAIDAAFDRRMRGACDTRVGETSRAGCFTMAEIADTAVDLNSRRQHYGAPVVETPFASGGLLALLAAFGLGATGSILALAGFRRRTRASATGAPRPVRVRA